jgi:hypothetical protein
VCNISSIDLSGNTELETLICDTNPLEALDVSNCTKLKRLTCGLTSLLSLDLSKNSELTALNATDCLKLSDIKFASNSSLQTVNLYRSAFN